MRQRPLSSDEVKACLETLEQLRAPELRIRLKAEAQVTGRISFALLSRT